MKTLKLLLVCCLFAMLAAPALAEIDLYPIGETTVVEYTTSNGVTLKGTEDTKQIQVALDAGNDIINLLPDPAGEKVYEFRNDEGTDGSVFIWGENPGRAVTIRGVLDANGDPLTTINGGNYSLAVGIKPRVWFSDSDPLYPYLKEWKYFIDVVGHPGLPMSINPWDCTPVTFEISNIKFVDPWISGIWIGRTDAGGSVKNCHFVDGRQVLLGNIESPPIAAAIDIVSAAVYKPDPANPSISRVSGNIELANNKIWCNYKIDSLPFDDAVEYGGYYAKGLYYGILKHFTSCNLTVAGNEIYDGAVGILSGAGTYSLHTGTDLITGNTVEIGNLLGSAPPWLIQMVGIGVIGGPAPSENLSAIINGKNKIKVVALEGPMLIMGIGVRRQLNASVNQNEIECVGGENVEDDNTVGIALAESSFCDVGQNILTGTAGIGIRITGTEHDETTPSSYPTEFNEFLGNNLATLNVLLPPDGATYYFDEYTNDNEVNGYTGGNKEYVDDNGTNNNITGVK